jgi:hypothetical protein
MARLPRLAGFVCYYGAGNLDALSRHPLVILEARNYTRDEIRGLERRGPIVVGYLSLGEVLEKPRSSAPAPTTPAGAPGAPAPAAARPRLLELPPYYLDRDGDGQPDRNGAWGSLYVDARSPAWQARVLDELVPELLGRRGVNGLFLDTLDTVDAFPETRDGMARLVARVRERWPAIPLVANRGFSMLDALVPLVDAFLFEAFSTRYDPATGKSRLHPPADLEWVDSILARIRSLGGPDGPQVLVLDYADPTDARVAEAAAARARRAGLPFSITTGSLDQLPVGGSGSGAPRRTPGRD